MRPPVVLYLVTLTLVAHAHLDLYDIPSPEINLPAAPVTPSESDRDVRDRITRRLERRLAADGSKTVLLDAPTMIQLRLSPDGVTEIRADSAYSIPIDKIIPRLPLLKSEDLSDLDKRLSQPPAPAPKPPTAGAPPPRSSDNPQLRASLVGAAEIGLGRANGHEGTAALISTTLQDLFKPGDTEPQNRNGAVLGVLATSLGRVATAPGWRDTLSRLEEVSRHVSELGGDDQDLEKLLRGVFPAPGGKPLSEATFGAFPILGPSNDDLRFADIRQYLAMRALTSADLIDRALRSDPTNRDANRDIAIAKTLLDGRLRNQNAQLLDGVFGQRPEVLAPALDALTAAASHDPAAVSAAASIAWGLAQPLGGSGRRDVLKQLNDIEASGGALAPPATGSAGPP